MYPTNRLAHDPSGGASQARTREILLRSLEGTIQRIDYREGEMTVVAEGRLWRFGVAADSRLWFDGRRALLRCFQPLDRVCIYYDSRPDGGQVVRALFGSEAGPADQTG